MHTFGSSFLIDSIITFPLVPSTEIRQEVQRFQASQGDGGIDGLIHECCAVPVGGRRIGHGEGGLLQLSPLLFASSGGLVRERNVDV